MCRAEQFQSARPDACGCPVLSSGAIAFLAEKGLSGLDIAELAHIMETEAPALPSFESKQDRARQLNAARQARYRTRQRAANNEPIEVLGAEIVKKEPRDCIDTIGITSRKKTAPVSRQHRLPENWYPDAQLLTEVATDFPNLDIKYETDSFRDHFLGKGACYADWRRTFRNWCRRSATKFGRRGNHQFGVDGQYQRNHECVRAAVDRYRNRQNEPRADGPRLRLIEGGGQLPSF